MRRPEGVQLWYTEYNYGPNWVRAYDAERRWTRSLFNGHGELSVVEEQTGALTTYTYTTRGELESVTHDYGTSGTSDDVTVTMSYDQAGRKTSMSDPDMGDWSYEYDLAGNLIEQTDGRGTVLDFDYDAIGRLTQRSHGAQVLATYTYDDPSVPYGQGRLTATGANGVTTAIGAYDADGNVLSSTLSIDGMSFTSTSTYAIDGKADTVTLPQVLDGQTEFLAAETLSYSYDGNGRVFSIVGADDIYYLREAGFTGEGLPEYLALGPQVNIGGQLYDTASRSWEYDPDTLRVAGLSAGSYRYGSVEPESNLQDLAYSYDDTGNVTSVVDALNSGQRQCFEYNNMNRLVSAFTGNSTCTAYSSAGDQPYDRDYSYDAVGNITQKGSLDDYAYGEGDAGPHAVTSVGDVSFTYDGNGNRVSRREGTATVAYTYDAENRLTVVENSADPDDTSFVYDADGARIKRAHGDDATYYIGPIEVETDQGDVTETHSIYSLGGGVTAVRVVTSPGDDGEVTFTFGDHLGSSSTVWQAGDLGDTDPGVRSFQRYYPYGEPRDDYDPNLPTDHTFTGQITDGLLDDGGTGLMYYGARYYDPQVGRFAAADTIVPNPGNPQDLNRYSYVGNNPVNGIDPSGHGPCYDEEGNPINCTDGTCTHSGGPPDSISMMTGTFDDSGCAYDEAGLGSALAGFVNWIGDGLSWLGREGWELLKEGARRLKEGGEYFVATTTRRFSNPTQSLFDLVTLTAFVEDLGGLYGTVIAGGDVDQTNCPAYATCIQRMHLPVLSAGSTAQAVGGTVLSEGRLTPRLGAHEGQHVRDMHELGLLGFSGFWLFGGGAVEERANAAEDRARAAQLDYGEDEVDLEEFYEPSILPHWLTPHNFRE